MQLQKHSPNIKMTDGRPEGPLQVIAYSSFRGDINDEQIISMLLDASRRNWIFQITGAIWFGESRFFQIIEGDALRLERLFDNIERDLRHRDIAVHRNDMIDDRYFSGFGTYVFDGPEDAAINALIARHCGMARRAMRA